MNYIIEEIIQKKPYLCQLQSALPDAEGNFEQFQTEHAQNGDPLISFIDKGKKRFLSSRYHPDEEALRAIPKESEHWSGREIIIILGIGNPLILDYAAKHLKEGQITIALESSQNLGCFLLHENLQTTQYLLRAGRHLFCGDEMLTSLWTYLNSIPSERLKGIRLIPHAPSINRNPQFYKTTTERIKSIIQARMSDLLTRFEFESSWITNSILNTERLSPANDHNADQNSILPYKDILKGVPGVLISAGPSLRNSVDLIRKLKQKSFLLCTDTALKVISSFHIVPHAVITLDSQKNTLRHFFGVNLNQTTLFCDMVTSPQLFRAVQPYQTLFAATSRDMTSADGSVKREVTPGTEFAETVHGKIGTLESGGSVATTAFDLLRFLGVSSIMLIGQDLAYTGREIHSTGTHHNESWLPTLNRTKTLENINERIIRKRETFYVSEIRQGELLTDYVLNMYRNWFEESIPAIAIPVYNLTYRGARIQGAVCPENIPSFVEKLPNVTLPTLLSMHNDSLIQESIRYPHKEFDLLQKDIANALAEIKKDLPFDEIKQKTEEFFLRYPFLRHLVRRAEVYSKRNRDKLTDERNEHLYKNNLSQSLERLLRSINRRV